MLTFICTLNSTSFLWFRIPLNGQLNILIRYPIVLKAANSPTSIAWENHWTPTMFLVGQELAKPAMFTFSDSGNDAKYAMTLRWLCHQDNGSVSWGQEALVLSTRELWIIKSSNIVPRWNNGLTARDNEQFVVAMCHSVIASLYFSTCTRRDVCHGVCSLVAICSLTVNFFTDSISNQNRTSSLNYLPFSVLTYSGLKCFIYWHYLFAILYYACSYNVILQDIIYGSEKFSEIVNKNIRNP